MKKKWKKLISLISAFAMVFATNITVFAATTDTVVNPLDTGKEILYYLFWTEDSKLKTDVDNLQQELSLTDNQIESLKQLGLKEHNSCKELKETYSSNTPSSINLFNVELEETAATNNQMIQEVLGNKTEDFRSWITEWWENERQYRTGSSVTTFSDINRISKIWATQYEPDTSGALEVALPDKYIKFANMGWQNNIPSNYKEMYSNPPYTVNVFNPDNSKTLNNIKVNDVGPWNINDNYWDSNRREFKDLNLGTPESYEAFYNNYNNGKDYKGRKVTNPAGIDLSTTAASQLGFSKNGSGFVDVRYTYLP